MKLHFKSYGEGRPLLILHGLFGSGDNWSTLGQAFAAEGFRVFLIDQRNHGRSPHSDDMDYVLLSDDLQEFIVDHQLHKPILLGHSMGGKTVMMHAVRFPGVASSMVVVDIAPRAYPPHFSAVLEALTTIDLNVLSSRKAVEEILRDRLQDEVTVQFLLKSLYWIEPQRLAWRFNVTAIAKHIDKISGPVPLKGAGLPSLFVHGEQSTYISAEDMVTIRTDLPEANFASIPRAGHWVHADQPADFFRTVCSFLMA